MNTIKKTLSFCLCLTLMAVCSCVKYDKTFTKEEENGGRDDGYTPKNFAVKGKVEKGPFISGSVIDMQPMNQEMHAVGSTYSATITDDMGSFSFNSEKFSEPYARLSVNGYFYNEYKGVLSNGQITLQSVVDLRDKSTVNVNLLTHIKYQRVLNLISKGATFADANAQAQEELLKVFGLQRFNTADVSQFSVAAGTDEAAALIATSALLLGERTEAQFTEFLAKLCQDFAKNGTFSEANQELINQDKEKLANKLEDIRQHLIDRYRELKRTITVKELVGFVDWDNNGTAGDEAHDPSKPITLSQESIEASAEGGTFTITYESDVKLYLSPQMGYISEISYAYINLTGQDISCKKEVTDDNTLIVTISPATYQDVRGDNIRLYDFVGNLVATIPVSQTGDPNGKWLTQTGESLFLSIKQNLVQHPQDLEHLHQYAYQLNPNSADVTTYHLDDVLITYSCLGNLLDDRMSEIVTKQDYLKRAIANLSEEPMGYCVTADQIGRMSADVARYVLAKSYLYQINYTTLEQRQECKDILEAIINKSVYSASTPILDVDNTTIISYHNTARRVRQRRRTHAPEDSRGCHQYPHPTCH